MTHLPTGKVHYNFCFKRFHEYVTGMGEINRGGLPDLDRKSRSGFFFHPDLDRNRDRDFFFVPKSRDKSRPNLDSPRLFWQISSKSRDK